MFPTSVRGEPQALGGDDHGSATNLMTKVKRPAPPPREQREVNEELGDGVEQDVGSIRSLRGGDVELLRREGHLEGEEADKPSPMREVEAMLEVDGHDLPTIRSPRPTATSSSMVSHVRKVRLAKPSAIARESGSSKGSSSTARCPA